MSANKIIASTYAVFLLAMLLLMGQAARALNPDRQLDQYRADIWVSKDGLPRSRVTSIAQTPDGYLWLGTVSGLVRFDGATFHRYDSSNTAGVAPTGVYSFAVAPSGELWLGTDGSGFGVLRPGRFVRFATGQDDKEWSRFYTCCWTHDGLLLAGGHHASRVGVLYLMRRNKLVKEINWPHGYVRGIVEDRSGALWCAVEAEGLVQLTPDGRIKRTWRMRDGLPGVDFRGLCLDTDGAIWIATAKSGVCRFRNGVFTSFTVRQGLPSDEVTSLYPSREGCVWAATRKGLVRWRNGRWRTLRSADGQEEGAVDALFEDREGNLWISTKRGLIRYCDTKLVPVYTKAGEHAAPLCITIGPDGRTWAGTADEGVVKPDVNGTCAPVLTTAQGLPTNHIDSLCTLRDGTMWATAERFLVRYAHGRVATFPLKEYPRFIRPDASGDLVMLDIVQNLYRFHEGKQVFMRHLPGSGWPFCCQVDRSNCIWIGSDTGLYRFTAGTLSPVQGWPHGRNALCMAFSPDGKTAWIGTDQGLARIDGHGVCIYGTRGGLTADSIRLLALDRFGTLWESTDTGIVSVRTQDMDAFDSGAASSISFHRYTQEDGFSDADVTDEAVQAHDGRVVFANHGGFTFIDPVRMPTNPYSPPVTIESAAANGKSVLFDRAIKVAPGEGALEVHFAAMSYVAPEKVRFRYRLEGHDANWIDVGTRRAAYYTNLPPAAYTFRVIACNSDGIWNMEGAAFSFNMLPHFWQTLWFRLLSVAAGLLMIAIGYRWRLRQMVLHTRQLDQQNREMSALNSELQRLNQLKDEFLANTSHELRTPLNGMIGIAESMLDGATGPLSAEQRYNMTLLTQSGKRLTNLVNDILDFSRLRHRELSLDLTPISLHDMVEMILQLDRTLVGTKDLQLVNEVPPTLPFVHADENRLQQILHNLIGNAIKFTPAGIVKVSAAVTRSIESEDSADSGPPWVAISISDNGIGIPEDKLDRVFESFEQVEGSARRQYGGTGLGLAITRSLIELHGGRIQVESVLGEGSVFTFTLPVREKSSQGDDSFRVSRRALLLAARPEPAQDYFTNVESEPVEARAGGDTGPHILIVDDEPVNLQVVKNILRLEHYRLTLASDGQQALALLEQGIDPDIILLDVMMPRMTGYEVVEIIRRKVLADRLPIILLSARNQPEDIVKGLEVGANDYLTKPISKEELVARVHTHLQIRQAVDARQKMDSELAIAAQIQRSMVPEIAVADGPYQRYDLAGLFQPARMVGGDLYDIFPLGDDLLCVVIGDVADKGVPAALLMARTVTLIRTLAKQFRTPVEILNAVNHELCANNEECLFVTAFCGILNLESGHFHYASAGHDPALLLRGQEIRFLALETGPPIGLEERAIFPEHECLIHPNDLILLYTDGITEAMNPQGELFSGNRLSAAVAACQPTDPAQVISAIQKAYHQFVGEAPQSDDLTLLALQFKSSTAWETSTAECMINGELSELVKVNRFLTEFLDGFAIPRESIDDAQLIAEEVLVNIMQYAYVNDDRHPIDLRVALSPECLRMTFEDKGRPFNPLVEIAAPDLTMDDEHRCSGGFGFHLVRALSTHLEYRYQDGKNILVSFQPLVMEPGVPTRATNTE